MSKVVVKDHRDEGRLNAQRDTVNYDDFLR